MPARKRTLLWIILAVATLGGVALAGTAFLFVLGKPMFNEAKDRAEENACAARLRVVYQGIIMYKVNFGSAPQESGIQFFAALSSMDGLREELEDVDGSAYAWRDMAAFPLERFPGDGSEPLAACNNKRVRHNPDVTHVLYTDGSIRALSLADLKSEGAVPPSAEELTFGPDSPVEDLRKLRRD